MTTGLRKNDEEGYDGCQFAQSKSYNNTTDMNETTLQFQYMHRTDNKRLASSEADLVIDFIYGVTMNRYSRYLESAAADYRREELGELAKDGAIRFYRKAIQEDIASSKR